MIDIFPQIYAGLKAHIDLFSETEEGKALIENRSISYHDAYARSEQKFPCITIEEKANSNSTGETDLVEKKSNLMYEINVYDNGKKRTEVCRKLAVVIDKYMAETMGFLREFGEPFPNIADATVYRYISRYEGYIDNETGNISRTNN